MRRVAVMIATLSLAAACTGATGTVSGGDPLLEASTSACDPTQHRWQDLYGCYFGPTGKANCSAQSTCHGSASGAGAKASQYVCGTTKEECYQGITTKIVPKGGSQDPTTSGLLQAIRKSDGTGTMPKSSTFAFQPADVDRIGAWIKEGAQDN